MTAIKLLKVFTLSVFLLLNGALASDETSAALRGTKQASSGPQSLRVLALTIDEDAFDAAEAEIEDLDDKQAQKKLMMALTRVKEELLDIFKQDKVGNDIDKFKKELDKLLEKGRITLEEHEDILYFFLVAIGEITPTTTTTTTTSSTKPSRGDSTTTTSSTKPSRGE